MEQVLSLRDRSARTVLSLGMKGALQMTQVLIADDDEAICETLQLLFEEAGYHTLTAVNGNQTLAIIQHHPGPLVVVLDIALPQVDGLSILRMVADTSRVLSLHKRTYIMTTGYHPAIYLPFADLLTQLEVAVLSKPFDIDDALTLVAQAASRL
jgi:CheY-like chemotaxis protein